MAPIIASFAHADFIFLKVMEIDAKIPCRINSSNMTTLFFKWRGHL